jgi:hypothetical protein
MNSLWTFYFVISAIGFPFAVGIVISASYDSNHDYNTGHDDGWNEGYEYALKEENNENR